MVIGVSWGMLTITGSIARQSPFPADIDRIRGLFLDLPALLQGVKNIDSVEKFENDLYRIIMKKVGALNYHLWLAADVQVVEHEDHITAQSLPYDPTDAWIGEGVLLYEYNSRTKLQPNGNSTHVDHAVEIKVHVPLPGFLKAVPMGMVKGAADALMTQNLASTLDDMEASARRMLR